MNVGTFRLGAEGFRITVTMGFTNGVAARTWTSGVMLLWVTALLAAYLLLYY